MSVWQIITCIRFTFARSAKMKKKKQKRKMLLKFSVKIMEPHCRARVTVSQGFLFVRRLTLCNSDRSSKTPAFRGKEFFTTKDRVRFSNDSIVITSVERDRGHRWTWHSRRSRASQRRFYFSVYKGSSMVCKESRREKRNTRDSRVEIVWSGR